jgi:signal transduction histidine kinase
MKQALSTFPLLYATGLRKYLLPRAGPGLAVATQLGRTAIASGLATLAVARIHDGVIATLARSVGLGARARRAEAFFTAVIVPIVEIYRAAREGCSDHRRLSGALGRRTAELATANRQLERGVTRYLAMKQALKESGVRNARLLKDSLRLQGACQRLTRRTLTAQEAGRKKISCELNDKVAQTLLGINVRLVCLQQEARGSTRGLNAQIASTQKLALTSASSLRQVARRLRNT